MKDRQFMIVLALVVAAGLAMGLIAARMSAGGGAATVAAPGGNAAAAAKPGNPPSGDIDQPAQPEEKPQTADVDSGEPRAPKVEPEEMKPPSSGDAPGTAAVEPGRAGEPQAPSGDSVQ